MIVSMDWPYFTYQPDGSLRTDDGDYLVGEDGKTKLFFYDVEQAEVYLIDNDIRGTVR